MTDQHLKLTGNLILDTMAVASAANVVALITLSDPVQMSLIQAVFGFLAVVFGGVITIMLRRMERHVTDAKQAIVQTQVKMEELEKNTNSIREELVKVTRSDALQEGETKGKEKAEAKAEAKAIEAPPAVVPGGGLVLPVIGTVELKTVKPKPQP